MVDALKKIDKKFLILILCIILLPVVLIIFLALLKGCSNKKMTYDNYEKSMVIAAEKYFEGKLPTGEGELLTVDLDTLVEEKYIKNYKKVLGKECIGQVTVRRTGISVESTNGGYVNYIYHLDCGDYSTTHLIDKITSEVVTSDSGLYKVGDKYIFKGNKVKNYIEFFGKNYRIVSIDKDGIMKLVKSETEDVSRVWDNKFNSEANATYGKTIYKDSSMLSYLISDYKNSKKFGKSARKHIVPYTICIGKRSINDNRISSEVDCSEKLENQLLSLLNVSDFAMASTDPDCNSTMSRSCRNYNYLYNVASGTWTLNTVEENTYEVFLLSGGLQIRDKANSYNGYSIVIYVDGNEPYVSGKGTSEDPYIIK